MALPAAVLRQHGDALNTLFNAQQAALILALVEAVSNQATAAQASVAALGIPAKPTAVGEYNLTILAANGPATWVVDGTH